MSYDKVTRSKEMERVIWVYQSMATDIPAHENRDRIWVYQSMATDVPAHENRDRI